MSGKRTAQTPVDVEASKGGHALVAWLDALPVAYRSEGDPERAEHLAGVVADQVEAIRRAKDGEQAP